MQARPAWSCPLLVPSGSETASTALTSAIFPYQVDFQSDHLAHFSSSFASGGHKNNPTSHGFTAFSGAEGLNAGQPRTVLPDSCARDAVPDAILWHPPISFPNAIPNGTRAASIVIPSGGRNPKPRDLQSAPAFIPCLVLK